MDERAAWDRWHLNHEVESTSPEGLLELHRVSIPRGSRFLDIGVGVGWMALAAVQWGAIVDALDVSPVAGEQVRAIVRRFYLESELAALPTGEYDLALSHLVAQHMTDDQLRRQAAEVYRALRPGGIFSIQFAAAARGAADRILPNADHVGHMVRTPEEALACLTYRPGEATVVREEPPAETSYYYIHVQKGKVG